MRRSGALIAMALLLGACGGSATKGPAVHARLQPERAPSALDVWRDGKGRLTFHWAVDNPGEIERYDPSTHALAEFSEGQALGSTRYLSNRAAWAHIHMLYGVTEPEVTSALASGTPSPEPVDYRVRAPLGTSGLYEGSTDYGKDIARMAKETGLILPRLASLGGYPLRDASMGPHGLGGIFFWPHQSGNSQIDLNIAVARPGHPDAPGTSYEQFFDKSRRYVRVAGTRYALVQGSAIFPYRGEWISVGVSGIASPKNWSPIVRAILAAPTR